MNLEQDWDEKIKFLEDHRDKLSLKEDDFIFGNRGAKFLRDKNKWLSLDQSKWLRDIFNHIVNKYG